MNRLIAALALALFVAAPSRAASTYSLTTDASSTTLKLNGRLHMQSLAGVEQLVVDSVRGLFTWTYGIQASTANFTGSGNGTYSVTTSSGVSVAAGGVTAPWFSASTGFFGSLFGNATTATSATTATNIAGGAAGSVPYQTGSGATSLVVAAAGKLLSIVGTTPTWLSFLPTTVSISTANVSPGFNGASNLVQLNASGQYPALDGSLITGIAGTLAGGVTGLGSFWTSATTLGSGPFSETSSSATVIAGSTFAVNGFASGFDHVIGTATVSAVATYTFNASDILPGAVISSSYTYTIQFNGVQNTATGVTSLVFNADTGAHYGYESVCQNTFGTRGVGAIPNGGSNLVLGDQTGPDAGTPFNATISFAAVAANSTVVQAFAGSSGINGSMASGTTSTESCYISGGYNGTAPLSSVTFKTSAGAFTGRLILKRTDVAFP